MGLFWLAIHPKHDKGTAASMDAWKGGRRLVPLPVAKNTGNSAHRRKVYGVRPIGQAHGAGSALTMCVNSTRDRKSTRLNPVTNAHLVCRLLLGKKNHQKKNA